MKIPYYLAAVIKRDSINLKVFRMDTRFCGWLLYAKDGYCLQYLNPKMFSEWELKKDAK